MTTKPQMAVTALLTKSQGAFSGSVALLIRDFRLPD